MIWKVSELKNYDWMWIEKLRKKNSVISTRILITLYGKNNVSRLNLIIKKICMCFLLRSCVIIFLYVFIHNTLKIINWYQYSKTYLSHSSEAHRLSLDSKMATRKVKSKKNLHMDSKQKWSALQQQVLYP